LCGENFLNLKLIQSVCDGQIFDRSFIVQCFSHAGIG